MKSKALAIAMLAMVLAMSGAIVMADESDAATTLNWNVNEAVDGAIMADLKEISIAGSVPGVSITCIRSGMMYYAYASGTPTTPGTYTVYCTPDGKSTQTFTIIVSSSVSSYTITFSAGTGGSVNYYTMTVASGTTYSASGNTMNVTTGSVTTTVTATPSSGYAFDHWSSTSGTITSNKTITAYFASVPSYTVTISKSPSAGGSVSTSSVSVPSGTSVSTSGSTLYIGSYTITANAASGYHFSSWSNASGTITGNRTITANFAADTTYYTVSIARSPSAGGSVSTSSVSVPSGTSVSTSGSTLYIGSYTITANAASGYHFSSWSNASGTINSNRTITANFAAMTSYSWDVGDTIQDFPLYIQSGNVTLSSGSAPAGTTITRTYISSTSTTHFVLSGTPTTTGTSTLRFSDGEYIQITINPAGTITYRTLTFAASPSAGGSVTYPSLSLRDGTTYYASGNTLYFDEQGATITVTASPNAGYAFDAWRSHSQLVTSGTISSDTSFQADFDQTTVYYTVSFTVTPQDSGSIFPASMTVAANTAYTISNDRQTLTVGGTTITPTPASGYVFLEWGVLESGLITENTTFPANFTSSTHTVTFTPTPQAGGTVSNASITVPHHTAYSSYRTSETAALITVGDVDVTATAAENYILTNWTNQGSGYVDSDITFEIYFAEQTIDLGIYAMSYGSAYAENVTAGTTSSTVEGPGSVTFTIHPGETIIAYAEGDDGYSFGGWLDINQVPLSNDNPWTFTAPYEDFDIVASFIPNVTVTIVAGEGGNVSEDSLSVPYGAAVSTDGAFLTIGTQTVTALPSAGYLFDSWSNASGTVTAPRIITANFVEDFGVYWSNGTVDKPTYNGRVDILFTLSENSAEHTMDMDLYSMIVNEDMSVNWAPTEYHLSVTVSFDRSAHIFAALSSDDSLISGTENPGAWKRLLISIDTEHGTVKITPVRSFTSYIQFTLYDSQTVTVLDFSNTIRDTAIREIIHSESGGGDSPRFSVTATNVFLDTFGVVMFSPEFNAARWFPQYDALRLNFYSFALYGDAMSINGWEWAVQDGKITVNYVKDQYGYHVPTYDPELPVQSKTLALNNIYVTWDGSRCSLTFVDDRFTLDLGTYQQGDLTVSFTGMWYFTTMLWDSTTGTEKGIGGWKALPETTGQQSILIFLGVLALGGAGAIVHIRRGGNAALDIVIMAAAGLVGYIMLG